jgi:hypothetical protein
MADKEIIALIWALVGAIAALASMSMTWPASLLLFALGIGSLVMAVRVERP